MALGDVTNSVIPSGGAPGAAAQAVKTVIVLGVCTGGTPATLYSPSSMAGDQAGLDAGPLAEEVALLLKHGAGQVFACPLNPSQAGGLAASVTQTGTGLATITPACAPHKAITIKCITGGTIGTATFQFSLDGGNTWGPVVTSVAAAPWTYLVPGTFCTLSFAAATYVAAKTNVVGVDGSVTPGSSWVGVVTQTSSPVDNYDMVATVIKGGALGTATIQMSPDGGNSTMPNMLVPASGTVVIPGTGVYLTCSTSGGNFVQGDTYSFACAAPGYSGTDLQNAMTAMMTAVGAPTVALMHVGGLPGAAASAFSQAATMESQTATAMTTYGKFWQAMGECPSASAGGDTIVSGGNAVADTADTDAVVKAARVGTTANHTSVCVGTHRVTSPITGWKLRRPTGWIIAARYVEANPNQDPSAVAAGPLDVFKIGRDEFTAATSLHDAQLNVLRTYAGRAQQAYLAIEQGGVGWRNCTTIPQFQDANAVRVLDVMLADLTAWGQQQLGLRPATNGDGTIATPARLALSSDADKVAKRATGLRTDGKFPVPQASIATAQVLATSQLGNSPKRLDMQYGLTPLGFVSQVGATTFFGTLNIQ